MYFRLMLLYYLNNFYYFLMGFVFGAVWRLKITIWYKLVILVFTILLPLAGFGVYLFEWIMMRRRKKKDKQLKDAGKDDSEENIPTTIVE